MSKREVAARLFESLDLRGGSAMVYIDIALAQVERETLDRAWKAALSHKSAPCGEECAGCEVVEKIRALKSG